MRILQMRLIFVVLLLSLGTTQTLAWLLAQFTEEKHTAYVKECRLMSESESVRVGLGSGRAKYFEACLINLDSEIGSLQDFKKPEGHIRLTVGQEITVIGSSKWADIFRPIGQTRDTGKLQGGFLMLMGGLTVLFVSRRKNIGSL